MKRKLIYSLAISAALFATLPFSACDEEWEYIDPVGYYQFYSLTEKQTTYLAGQKATINGEEKTLFSQSYILSLNEDFSLQFFQFGGEELTYGKWEEAQEENTLTFYYNESECTASYDAENITFTMEDIVFQLKKTQKPTAQLSNDAFGTYEFFSLNANGAEYLEGETWNGLEPLNGQNFNCRILPNGFLNCTINGEKQTLLWETEKGALYFLLPNSQGAKKYQAYVNTTSGTLTLIMDIASQTGVNQSVQLRWELHQAY